MKSSGACQEWFAAVLFQTDLHDGAISGEVLATDSIANWESEIKFVI